MTQATLDFQTTIKGDSLCAHLARFFDARQGEWIDGRRLAQIAGAYAWRSRVSDLRKQPYAMPIENRQLRMTAADGVPFTVSEYRYVPSPAVVSGSGGEKAADCQ